MDAQTPDLNTALQSDECESVPNTPYRRLCLILILAIFALSSVCVWQFLQQTQTSQPQTTPTLIATRLIHSGEDLSPDNTRVEQWLPQRRPEKGLSSVSEAHGYVALGPIPANGAISLYQLGHLVLPR